MVSFIPFIILNIKNRNLSKNNEIINAKLVYRKEYFEKYKAIKFKKYGLIFLFSVLNFIINLIYYGAILDIEFDYWLFDIIFMIGFSYLILNIKLYQHQYFSSVIILISVILLHIINQLGEKFNFINLLLSLFTEQIYSLNITVNKYLMEYMFCSPFEICFYNGIISLILFTISLIISTNTEIKGDNFRVEYKGKFYVDNFFAYYEKFNIKELFVFIFEIINYFIYYLFSLITIQKYTACHCLIILIFDVEITFLLDFKIKWRFILNITFFAIILFMLLVFNEIIEINCFGFQINTRNNISKRAQLDSLNINENNENYEDTFENENYLTKFLNSRRNSEIEMTKMANNSKL